jgi:exosortase/archaeosortase family protein
MGLPILLLINFVRMISLVLIGPHWPEFHDVGHLYTWPAIIITVALALWLTWINAAYTRLAAAGEPIESRL